MIKDLKPGEEVVEFFVLRKKEVKLKRETNEFYLSLELGDVSGRITGSVWENPQKLYEKIARGDILKVKAKTIDYKDKLHLNIEKVRKAEKRDEFDIDALIPKVEAELESLLSALENKINMVNDPFLKELLTGIFTDDDLMQKFKQAPGGKLWHHNYLGGLLEHTLNVTEIAIKVGELYGTGNLDLLLAAGLLHDIGKIDAYKYDTLIDFTDEGRLHGHIVMGAQIVRDRIRNIKDFPAELEKQLIHLILSHQGKLEQASPVVPMTLEGLILYYADEIDSKANAFMRIKKKEKGQRWSSYVELMNQYFYLGEANE